MAYGISGLGGYLHWENNKFLLSEPAHAPAVTYDSRVRQATTTHQQPIIIIIKRRWSLRHPRGFGKSKEKRTRAPDLAKSRKNHPSSTDPPSLDAISHVTVGRKVPMTPSHRLLRLVLHR